MTRLLGNSTVKEIVRQSYSGVYVDEYQDCLRSQHVIVRQLASLIPCRIAGDPMQSIFGFGRNTLADWESEVMVSFRKIGESRPLGDGPPRALNLASGLPPSETSS